MMICSYMRMLIITTTTTIIMIIMIIMLVPPQPQAQRKRKKFHRAKHIPPHSQFCIPPALGHYIKLNLLMVIGNMIMTIINKPHGHD